MLYDIECVYGKAPPNLHVETFVFAKHKNSKKSNGFTPNGAAAGEAAAGAAGEAGTKTCRDTTLISRRVTHARNANTNTKHDFPVGGVTKDSPPQPPIGNEEK